MPIAWSILRSWLICDGHRFHRETLEVRYKGKNVADVLEMDVQEALEHFENIPKVNHKLQTLHDVGLDYMKLGQPSPTLSGETCCAGWPSEIMADFFMGTATNGVKFDPFAINGANHWYSARFS